MKFIISLMCLSSLISTSAFAQTRPTSAPNANTATAPNSDRAAFAYPELQVSPRATERVFMEARNEAKTRKTQLLPLQISALSTVLAGALAPKPDLKENETEKDDVKYSRQVAIGVGVAWLAFSYFFNEDYTPYTKAQSVLKAMPDKTPQDELVRERIAEENIEAAASLGQKMMWASFVTNLGASAYLAGNTSKEGTVYAAAAGVLAFAPLVFRDRWQTVNSYHQDYKKRIYGPISLPTLMTTPQLADSRSVAVIPGVQWYFSF